MSFLTILFIVILCCSKEVFTRFATVSISLNLSAHVSDENNQFTEQMVRICMKETQLSMSDLEKFKTNQLLDSETNESTQCFAHCIYEQMGVIKNGIFIDNDDTQKLVMTSTKDNAEFLVCQTIRGNNKCETAYKIHQCIQKVKYGTRDQTQSLSADLNTNNTDDDDDDSSDSINGQ